MPVFLIETFCGSLVKVANFQFIGKQATLSPDNFMKIMFFTRVKGMELEHQSYELKTNNSNKNNKNKK